MQCASGQVVRLFSQSWWTFVFECVDVYKVDGKDRGKGKRSKSTNTHSTALYWWMKMLNEWRQSEEKAPHTSMHICRLLTAHFACRCQCQKWLKWAKLNELSHWLDSLSAVCRRLRQRKTPANKEPTVAQWGKWKGEEVTSSSLISHFSLFLSEHFLTLIRPPPQPPPP